MDSIILVHVTQIALYLTLSKFQLSMLQYTLMGIIYFKMDEL